MRGHEPLIEMRKSGYVPDIVFLDVDRDKTESWRDWPTLNNDMASVLIEPSDKHFDFRFLIDLTCYVHGESKPRVYAVRDALIDAGAKQVVTTLVTRIGDDEFVAFKSEHTDSLNPAANFNG